MILQNGWDGLPEALSIISNEAMSVERSRTLRGGPSQQDRMTSIPKKSIRKDIAEDVRQIFNAKGNRGDTPFFVRGFRVFRGDRTREKNGVSLVGGIRVGRASRGESGQRRPL